ncbi:MAG TPA: DUF4231 domain-containing protein [Albitalea sp.]|jgi:uncharacterized membrane protein YhaH (DUF805 family)|nr:DUF4231 domain-containing protein [Albitalea sp.]
MPDTPLQAVADVQGKWSTTANRLKADYQQARWLTFALSIAAALLAAVASQVDGQPRAYLAALSTVLFAGVTFLAARRLDAQRAAAWVRARSAAEALKRAAYKFAVQASPYDDPASRDTRFNQEVDEIEQGVDDLLGQQVDGPAGSAPVAPLSPDEYAQQRVREQIAYFESNALALKAMADRMRRAEFWLALVTACITAIVGVAGKDLIGGLKFDFVALTAVLTTISGAILAHIEASRYDFTVTAYRAAARRLRDALRDMPAHPVPPSAEWSAFVDRIEGILADENSSWVAKFGKPA